MRQRRWFVRIIAALAAAIATMAVWLWVSRGDRRVDRLQQALERLPERPIAGRLSPPYDVYAPRPDRRHSAASPALRAAAAELVGDPSTLPGNARAAAVARLLAGDARASVTSLEAIVRMNPGADACADLAAAHLALAEEPGAFDSNLDALAAADRALVLNPSHPSALFNRAVAQTRLGLAEEARTAWSDAARADPDSEWGKEAATAFRGADSGVRKAWREADAEAAATSGTDATLRQILRESPRLARSWAEAVFPSKWAEARLHGDDDAAARALEVARSLGALLATAAGERMSADAVAVIDRSSRGDDLARAYIRYRDGRLAHRDQQPVAAERLFREAESLFATAKSPMAHTARYYAASALYSQGRLADAGSVLDGLAAMRLADRGYRALAAQIGWERGLCLVLRGSLSDAIDVYNESRTIFDAIGDADSRSAMDQLLADALEEAGESEQAWIVRKSALETLVRFGRRERKTTFLSSAADVLIYNRQWDRAAAILNVAVPSAGVLNAPPVAAQIHLQRALVRAMRSDVTGSGRDLADHLRWRKAVTDDAVAARLDAQRLFIEGLLQRERAPRDAIALFDRAGTLIHERGGERSLTWVHLEKGRTQRGLGDETAARASFEAALEIVEEKRKGVRDAEQRALTFASAAEVFADAIALEIDAGDAAAAFDLSERARARALLDRFEKRSFAARETAQPYTATEIRARLAPHAAIVHYASLQGRLAAFVVRRQGVTLVVRRVTNSGLRESMARCAEALREHEGNVKPCAAARDLLLLPIETYLRDTTDVTFVLDPALGGIPVPVLGRELRWRSITEAPSATIAVKCATRARARAAGGNRMFAVAATQFSRGAYPDAAPLPWASRELDVVAALYPGSVLVTGRDATPRRFLDELPKAEVVHLAGHAVTLNRRPSGSRLLLAPGKHDDGSLDALRLADLDLPAARVVYLSACQTARPAARADGIDNLATALLVAGAPAVIAAKWDVSDDLAPRTAAAFHREFAARSDPAEAAQKTIYASPTLGLVVLGASRHLVE